MDYKLSLAEKKDIVMEFGSSIRSINKILKILNDLNIFEDEEELYDLICAIATEVEANKILKATDSSLVHKSLAEIIAITIFEKYEYLDELPPISRVRAKVFINNFYPNIFNK